MSGITTKESSFERSIEGVSSEQRCESGEALVEWRSAEQVENGTPSTCPPYWDSDDDDDGGPKPAELCGKYTWKIDKFSQINKRELRSNAFDVGGYKWYILIYPQGCDVCNHLSLFLCVANHDKLLPGWSHFAQFTIAVVNNDPKKSKYSDTLHRFWKKEHDWGWKKFMELSKLFNGFINADTLIIKAQVQVIRERADRPFRCLDSQYRRELVRVYLTNVEQNCRHFVEEQRAKLAELIDHKAGWSSFKAFWMGMEQNSKYGMSREKIDSILKLLVKHFFIEKEVTSTLVMDSLYSGVKALESRYKGKKSKGMYLENDEYTLPIVRMEKDNFLLIDDVLTLLERAAAVEPLPQKDEKGPQNRTKDGALGEEFNKDWIEREERRLTELGRRTIEIFVLSQIFSKIEVAYQEAVALKRQDELIREEEAAWLAQIELKARRGVSDKEKKSKKKQGKQRRNRKGKDKGRNDNHSRIAQDKIDRDIAIAERRDSVVAELDMIIEKCDALEDVSDVSDSVECVPEILVPDSKDTDIFEVQNGTDERSSSVVEDSSSTCSSDSTPFVVINGSRKVNSKNQKSRSRERNCQSKSIDWVNAENNQPYRAVLDTVHPIDARNSKVNNQPYRDVPKEEETDSLRKNYVFKNVNAMSVPRSPSKNVPFNVESKDNVRKNHLAVKKSSFESHKQVDKSLRRANSTEMSSRTQMTITPSMPVISRPLSAPSMPAVSVVPTVQTQGQSPQSYRNVIVGGHIAQNHSTNSGVNASLSYSKVSALGMVSQHNVPAHGPMWIDSPPERNSPVVDRASLINDMRSSDLSGRQSHSLPDEFPHLDIINDLLDDEHGIGNLSISNAGYRGFSGAPPYLDGQVVSFPCDPSRVGLAMGSCRFERIQSYCDYGLQQSYCASGSTHDVRQDVVPRTYGNCQVDGLVPYQCQIRVSDFPFVCFGNTDSGPYRVGGYQNRPVGVNDYTMFRPTSGL